MGYWAGLLVQAVLKGVGMCRKYWWVLATSGPLNANEHLGCTFSFILFSIALVLFILKKKSVLIANFFYYTVQLKHS